MGASARPYRLKRANNGRSAAAVRLVIDGSSTAW